MVSAQPIVTNVGGLATLGVHGCIAGVDVTLCIGAKMQHVFPVYAGFMPEADQAIALIGAWVRSRL